MIGGALRWNTTLVGYREVSCASAVAATLAGWVLIGAADPQPGGGLPLILCRRAPGGQPPERLPLAHRLRSVAPGELP